VLHVIVLGALVRLAGFASAPGRFDVFAADPVEAAPEPFVVQSAPERPRPIVGPLKARLPQPDRSPVSFVRARPSAPSRVVVGAKSALPPDPSVAPTPAVAAPPTELAAVAAIPPSSPDAPSHPSRTDFIAGGPVSVSSVAPIHTEVQLSSPSPSEVEDEGSFPPRWAPESFAALEPPTTPSVASMTPPPAAPRADVLRPVPGMPLTVAAAAPPPMILLEGAALKQQSAESPRKIAAAPARSEPASAPATTAGAPAPATAAPAPALPPSPPIPVATGGVAPSTPAAPTGVEPSRPPAIVSAAPTRPPRSDPPAATPATSPLGLGLGRLRIRLDGDSVRTTDRETDVISGTLVGGQPERVVVQVDERTSVPTLAGRAFATAVKLSPGVNRVRVLATDAQGAEVEEVVTVRYKPPVAADVAIMSPPDGHTLAADDPPLVAVEGQVSDAGQSTVWIVANDRRVMVPVTAGRFRHVLPVLEPLVRVRAETGSDGPGSATVTVNAGAAMPAIGLFLVDWPRHTAGPAKMTVTWRPNPANLDGGPSPMPLRGLTADTDEAGVDAFYLRNARPGVYTFSMTYPAGAAPVVRPVLYVGGTSRSLQPVTLNRSGRAVVARLLLPQGVLWEQDDWFTGRSASGDTVTKFRFPEGVSWIERLGDLGP
jgi:hypothetical protein